MTAAHKTKKRVGKQKLLSLCLLSERQSIRLSACLSVCLPACLPACTVVQLTGKLFVCFATDTGAVTSTSTSCQPRANQRLSSSIVLPLTRLPFKRFLEAPEALLLLLLLFKHFSRLWSHFLGCRFVSEQITQSVNVINNNNSATTTHLSLLSHLNITLFSYFSICSDPHQPMLQMFEFWSFNINKIKLGLGPNATPSSGRDGADRRRSTLAPLPNGTTTLAHHPSSSPSPSPYPPPLGHSNQNLYQNCAAAVVPGNVSVVCVCSAFWLLNFRTLTITSLSLICYFCVWFCLPGMPSFPLDGKEKVSQKRFFVLLGVMKKRWCRLRNGVTCAARQQRFKKWLAGDDEFVIVSSFFSFSSSSFPPLLPIDAAANSCASIIRFCLCCCWCCGD